MDDPSKLKAVYKKTFTSPEGFEVLKHIRKIGRGNLSSIKRDSESNICINELLVNEGRKLVWLEIQKYLNKELKEQLGGQDV